VTARNVRSVVVPVGGANFASLARACEGIGVAVEFSDQAARIAAATHVILPGVGAARPAMSALRERGLARCLTRLTQPVLGICLGMQLLFERSDEGGGCDMLGLIPGGVERLAPAPTWPHMGWNTLENANSPHRLLDGIGRGDWFYFVHGHAARPAAHSIATSDFGAPFCAAVAHGNFQGVQFHPEKSSASGRTVLANFFAQ